LQITSVSDKRQRMHAELIHLASWLKRLTQWIVISPKLLWLALSVIFVVVAVALWLEASERIIRLTGLILQVFGIATVIWGIESTRRLFDHPTLLAVAAEWLKQYPPYRRGAVIAVGTGEVVMTGAKARAYVTSNPPLNATLEQRIASLEANVRHLNKRIDEGFREMDELERVQKAALGQERQERTAEDVKIAAKLELSGTGGLHISAIGALWLFVGVILSTAAPDIAQWFELK
jgi:hypothetical protein